MCSEAEKKSPEHLKILSPIPQDENKEEEEERSSAGYTSFQVFPESASEGNLSESNKDSNEQQENPESLHQPFQISSFSTEVTSILKKYFCIL